ncbi:hypothetical protein RSOLAG1IB_08608 [Rhizoctonia solani AG-1 IB]|uniref:Uncharacterized protein n=1 Tax=Thanatephorus cucumeris (strain AG1-IB / isolate 7/3/14) TaxID=1108050 RepID=A0A0B7FQT1_THACB|nr:hypothetical protein RSOLAG1IB_08608 [Rhizoctonia solani AG-1 IB]
MSHLTFPTSPEEKDSFGESGYYVDALVGVHSSLNFMGRRPLFVLKDEWETTPPLRETGYYQVIDPRTQLFMDLVEKDDIKIRPVALVQWKVPHAGPGLNMIERAEGEEEPEPDYILKLAMTQADVMGVGEEEEEELDVVSSDDEESMQFKKGKFKEDDSLTVYYPLISLPSENRGDELREVLRGPAHSGRGATSRYAKEWLDDIERVDKIPTLHHRV